MKKSRRQKLERYGNIYGDLDKIRQTKLARSGNAVGINTERMIALHGVPFPCRLPQCIAANGKRISKVNQWWHDKLLQALDIDFALDATHIDKWTYDLTFAHVLVEICPTISHNSTHGFAFLSGRSTNDMPIVINYHFDKTQLALKHGYTCITIFE